MTAVISSNWAAETGSKKAGLGNDSARGFPDAVDGDGFGIDRTVPP